MTSAPEIAHELIVALRDAPSPASTTRGVRPALVPVGDVVNVASGNAGAQRIDLVQTLRTRRSTRFYGAEALPAPELLDTIARGLAVDAENWPSHAVDHPLEVSAVAFRIDGLAPGVYVTDVAARTATPVAALPEGDAIRELTLQSEFCDAAVILTIGADLQAASVQGAHGYRLLMERAASAAYTMWLDAVSRGWTGSVFAGLLPASVRRPLASDGASRHQLFALALGHPADLSSFSPPTGGGEPTEHREEESQ